MRRRRLRGTEELAESYIVRVEWSYSSNLDSVMSKPYFDFVYNYRMMKTWSYPESMQWREWFCSLQLEKHTVLQDDLFLEVEGTGNLALVTALVIAIESGMWRQECLCSVHCGIKW